MIPLLEITFNGGKINKKVPKSCLFDATVDCFRDVLSLLGHNQKRRSQTSMSASGQKLPRPDQDIASALPSKAAAAVADQRGSSGPILLQK